MAVNDSRLGVCPRCDICGKVVRTVGVGVRLIWCRGCLSENMPFVGLESDGAYKEALREFREGIGYGVANFEGARFDPLGEEERALFKQLDKTLRGCKYSRGLDLKGQHMQISKSQGCSLSILFHNITVTKKNLVL